MERATQAVSYLTVPQCSKAAVRKCLLKKAQEERMGPSGPDLATKLACVFQVPAKAVLQQ